MLIFNFHLMRWQGLFLVVCVFLSISVIRTSAFRCYVCDSKDDIECTEHLPPNSRLISHDCQNITGAKFCIKTTNLYAGEFGTKRFCAANDHGNYCKYVRQPTGDREHRSCVLTCDSDNCNGSRAQLDRQSVVYLGSIALIASLRTLERTLSAKLVTVT